MCIYIYIHTHTQDTSARLVFVLVLICKMLQTCTILYLFCQSVCSADSYQLHGIQSAENEVLCPSLMGSWSMQPHLSVFLRPPFQPTSCALMFLEHAEHICFPGSCLKCSIPGYLLALLPYFIQVSTRRYLFKALCCSSPSPATSSSASLLSFFFFFPLSLQSSSP